MTSTFFKGTTIAAAGNWALVLTAIGGALLTYNTVVAEVSKTCDEIQSDHTLLQRHDGVLETQSQEIDALKREVHWLYKKEGGPEDETALEEGGK